HPMAEGHPWCAGCHWQFADVFPGPARLVEIWNGPWDMAKNELGLRLFQTWLNKGIRMRAQAGTDIHGPKGPEVRYGYNRVWAEAFTEEAILAGIRAGRNVITHGPVLNLQATSGDAVAGVGQELGATCDIQLLLHWEDVPAGAQLIVETGSNGDTSRAQVSSIEGQGEAKIPLGDLAPRSWIMCQMRCAKGDMLVVTNPVFVEGDWND
ncbi:MAG: CehA/McbA family metallohydrolase, partial [Pseudomonadota bacterium]